MASGASIDPGGFRQFVHGHDLKRKVRIGVLQLLLSIAWLAERLSEFYPPDEARMWPYTHYTHQKLLDGVRPVDRIQEGAIDEVLALIDQLQSGTFI